MIRTCHCIGAVESEMILRFRLIRIYQANYNLLCISFVYYVIYTDNNVSLPIR